MSSTVSLLTTDYVHIIHTCLFPVVPLGLQPDLVAGTQGDSPNGPPCRSMSVGRVVRHVLIRRPLRNFVLAHKQPITRTAIGLIIILYCQIESARLAGVTETQPANAV